MTLTIREINKYSKIQKETAEWVAERFVYMCKIHAKEVEKLSTVIQNQEEVFEKEHANYDGLLQFGREPAKTMKELADKLKRVKMNDFEILPYETKEITTYYLNIDITHVLSHLGMALNGRLLIPNLCDRKLDDAFCRNIAQTMIDYFEQYNLTVIFQYTSRSLVFLCHISVRTNGLVSSDLYF